MSMPTSGPLQVPAEQEQGVLKGPREWPLASQQSRLTPPPAVHLVHRMAVEGTQLGSLCPSAGETGLQSALALASGVGTSDVSQTWMLLLLSSGLLDSFPFFFQH